MADYDGKKYKETDPDSDGHSETLVLLEKAQSADHDMRTQARESMLFITNRNQWEPMYYNRQNGQPRYSFDMVGPIVDQVSASLEQADFDIRVNPAGGSATKKTASTYDGIIRNIESMSSAKRIYAHAARGMVTTGYDGWRVSHDYQDDDSFDMDLLIEPLYNYIDRVWWDPSCEMQDRSDARYCFVLHPVALDEYDRRWPEGGGASVSDDRDGEAYFDKAEVVLIGEYLYCEYEERDLVMMSNGQVYEVDEDFEKIMDELAMLGVTEVRRRTRMDKSVCSRMFDANGWLEEKKETVFDKIPIISAYGNYKVFENKPLYAGVVDKLIDPQRVMNYSMSRAISETSLAPRSKWLMTMTQAAGHEDTIRTLNTNADPVQFYNNDPEVPGPPQQIGGATVNPGLTMITDQMRGMISYASGMFAANMGDNPGLQSGVAIDALQNKGDEGTLKYHKAIQVAIECTGKILVKAIPKVYDTQRVVRIMKEDREYDMAEINTTVPDLQSGQMISINDLSEGQYDVTVRAGPSFRNRQEETITAILEMAKVDPSILELGGDVLLDNFDTPAGEQLSNRKRAMMIKQGIIPMDQMTEEELQSMQAEMQQSQQPPPPDPAIILAQAEMMKAEAEMMKAQTDMQQLQMQMAKLQIESEKNQVSMQKTQADVMNDQTKNQISAFDSETKRMTAQVAAEKAGATINMTNIESFGEQLENQQKMNDIMQEEMARTQIAALSDEELLSRAARQ